MALMRMRSWALIALILIAVMAIVPAVSALTITGAEWNTSDPSPTLRRIDIYNNTVAAPDFNVTYPWSSMVRVNNSETQYQIMRKTGAFWYRSDNVTENGFNYRRWWIADTNTTGFKLHPEFISDSLAKNASYIGAYDANVWNATTGYNTGDFAGVVVAADKLSSQPGMKPTSGKNNTITMPNFRTLANNRNTVGQYWGLETFQQVSAEELLFIVEYATLNSQSVYVGVTQITDDGSTNMAVPTGSTVSCGNSSCVITTTHYKTGQTTYPYSFRGDENGIGGNIWIWIDGINIKADRKPWIADNGFASNTFSAPYVDTGLTNSATGGYPTNIGYNAVLDYGFLPSAVGGSTSTYLCDYYWQETGNLAALFGGSWADALNAGAAYWSLSDPASAVYRSVGARLAYIPQDAPLAVPTVSFTPNATTGIGSLPVLFTDTTTTTGTEPATTFSWNATNVTGNNIPFTFSTSRNATYTFPTGNYSIVERATSIVGTGTSSQVTWINVSDSTPLCLMSPWPQWSAYDRFVTLTDSSTNNPTNCTVSWGDSVVEYNCDQYVYHLYQMAGIYPLDLTVSNAGGTATNRSWIQIME